MTGPEISIVCFIIKKLFSSVGSQLLKDGREVLTEEGIQFLEDQVTSLTVDLKNDLISKYVKQPIIEKISKIIKKYRQEPKTNEELQKEIFEELISEVFPKLRTQLDELSKKISIVEEFPDYFRRIEGKIDLVDEKVRETFDLVKDTKYEYLKKDIQISKSFNDIDKIFKSISEGLSGHPSLDMRLDIDGKSTKIEIHPKGKDILSFKLHLKSAVNMELNERLNDSLKTRKPLILEKKEFIEAVLSSEDIPKIEKPWEIEHIEFIPQPFPAPNPFKIELPEANFSLDYVMIGIEYQDDEKIIMGSKNTPIEIKFTAFKDKKAVNSTMSYSIKNKSLEEVLLINDFLEAVHRSKKIVVKDLEKNKIILEGNLAEINLGGMYHPEWHEFIKKLVFIGKKMAVSFSVPDSTLSPSEYKTVAEVYQILKGGSVKKVMDILSFEMKIGALKNLIDLYLKEGKITNFTISSPDVKVELFDKTFGLGPGKRRLPDLKFSDLDKLKHNIQNKQDLEFMKVTLTPIKDKTFIEEYSNFKPAN